jgi:hypothetical protein
MWFHRHFGQADLKLPDLNFPSCYNYRHKPAATNLFLMFWVFFFSVIHSKIFEFLVCKKYYSRHWGYSNPCLPRGES